MTQATMRTPSFSVPTQAALLCTAALVAFGCASAVLAGENPTSYGSAATVDTPILRIPMGTTPPDIDGVMAEGEWEASEQVSRTLKDTLELPAGTVMAWELQART